MKIAESNTKTLFLTDLDGIDPITVFLEDFELGQGRITIVCWGKSWTSFWGSMGSNIAEFFISVDEHYIAKNLSDIDESIVDYELISKEIGEEVDKNTMALYHREIVDAFEDLPMGSNPKYEYLCRIIKAVQSALRKLDSKGEL